MTAAAEPLGRPPRALSPAARQVRVPKMAEMVAAHLRRQIVRGELAEGAPLPSEAALMEQFQVSRPTLREAFTVLESESLISVRRGPRGGARVRSPDADVAARYAGLILQHQGTALGDVLEARSVIEPQAVARLARTRTEDDVARLRAHLEPPGAGEPVPAPLAVLHRLEAFHALLIELTGNETLRVLMGMLERIVQSADRSRVESDAGEPEQEQAVKGARAAHARVVDLIEAGDDAGAQRLWRSHLIGANEYLLRAGATTVLEMLD